MKDPRRGGAVTRIAGIAIPLLLLSCSGSSGSEDPDGEPPSIALFSASPQTITAGSSTVLTWSCTGAASTWIDQGIGPVTGTTRVVAPASTTTYTLTATNVHGTATAHTTVIVQPDTTAPVIASFTATPSTIGPGGSAVLTWEATGADTLVLDPGIGEVTGANRTVSPSATTTYTLTANGPGGTVTAQVTVVVMPLPVIAAFAATPGTVGPGGASVLSWNVSGAEALTIDNGVGAVSGASVVVRPSQTTTYRLTATNAVGAVAASTSVTVLPIPAIVEFRATPGAIAPGSSSVLAWNVSGADTVTLSPGIGAVTGTTRTVTPASTTTYTLTAINAIGSASLSVTVTVQPPPVIASFTASPGHISEVGSATLTWSVTGADEVSIDQGIGAVSGTSRTVTPRSTTTYMLTARNATGSATASATVLVSEIVRWDAVCPATPVAPGVSVAVTTDFLSWTGTPDFDIEWSAPDGGTVLPSRGTATTFTAPNTPGAYRVYGASVWNPLKDSWCYVTVEQPPNTWRAVAPMPTPRSEHTATLLPSGKVLVAGGSATASAIVFDPATERWTATSPMTKARSGHRATLLNSGKVLITGSDGSAEVYDPETNGWSATGSMTRTSVGGHTATLLASGKVLVTGGGRVDPPVPAFSPVAELYDPMTGTWTRIAEMLLGRAGHTATLLTSGKVLVVGGKTYDSDISFDSEKSELYDSASGTWAPGGSSGCPCTNQTATLLASGEVITAGGLYCDLAGTVRANVDRYSPVYGSWLYAPHLLLARMDHTATLLPSGRVLIAGGWTGGTGMPSYVLDSAELLDQSDPGLAKPMAVPRVGHSAVSLPSGDVLVVGGRNDDGALASAEIYRE